MTDIAHVYTGHDPALGDEGTDLLLTEYADGHRELAMRPGHGQRWVTWGAPVSLCGDEHQPEGYEAPVIGEVPC